MENITNEQILKQAIEKAMRNGFAVNFGIDSIVKITMNERYGVVGLLFNHDFAKAFWGEEKVCRVCGDETEINCYCNGSAGGVFRKYEFHLQEMVLEKEPLQYLKKFL